MAGLLGAPPGSRPGLNIPSSPTRSSETVVLPISPVSAQRPDVLPLVSSPATAEGVFSSPLSVSVPVSNPPSWSDIAQNGGKPSFPVLNFFPPQCVDGETAHISPPLEIIHQSQEIWKSTLLGFFSGKSQHIKSVAHIARRIWQRFDIRHIAESDDGSFLFRFSFDVNRDAVLARGPWYFKGIPIFLHRWHPGMPLAKENFRSLPIWIKLRHVPVEFWSPLGLCWISSTVGKPINFDAGTARMDRLHYARVCVEVKQDAILPTKIVLCNRSASEMERVVEVEVEFPVKSLRRRPSAGKPSKKGVLSNFRPQSSSIPAVVSCELGSPDNSSAPHRSVCHPASVMDLGVIKLETLCAQLGKQDGSKVLDEAPSFRLHPAVIASLDSGVAEPVDSGVVEPMEHDEKQTILEPVMQSPEVQYAVGDPTGCSEVGFLNEESPPGPPASLFDQHISGPCAEVDISHGLVRDVSLELPHPGVEMIMAPCCSPAGHDGCAGCALNAEDCVLPLPHCPAPLVNHQSLNTLIEDLDSTPESIARLTCKYNLVQSVSEIVGNSVLDVNDSIDCCPDIDSTQSHVKSDVTVDGSDPLSRAIQLLTKVEVLRPSLDALTLEHKIMVLLFLDNCWCNVSDQMKDEFKKSFSCDGVSLLSSVDAPLEALRWTVLAHPHIGSLSMNEKQIVFDFLRSLMNLLSDSSFDHFCNLDDLVDGLHERRKMEVFKNITGAVHNSEWSIAKSKRKRNNASKTSIGFPANR